jgi:hypothetical protein
MTVLAKTSIALALIVAVCSSAVAQTWTVAGNDYGKTVLINRCVQGAWDVYELPCDSGE